MTVTTMNKIAVSLSTLAASVMLNVSCGSSAENSETSIYGGKATARGEFYSSVAITNKYMGVFCSGTAISPTVVITAAHCVASIGANPSDNYVYVGNGQESGRYIGQFQVKSIKASPNYSAWSSSGQNDIAYLVLAEAIPLPKEAFVPVATTKSDLAELLRVGKSTRVIGFGGRENGSMGVKYEVDAPIRQVGSNEIVIGGQGKDSCQGDSGGPAYGQLANGEWRVFGVVSRGGRCGTGGYYGLMHANICWIQNSSGQDLGLPAGTCVGNSAGVSASRPE